MSGMANFMKLHVPTYLLILHPLQLIPLDPFFFFLIQWQADPLVHNSIVFLSVFTMIGEKRGMRIITWGNVDNHSCCACATLLTIFPQTAPILRMLNELNAFVHEMYVHVSHHTIAESFPKVFASYRYVGLCKCILSLKKCGVTVRLYIQNAVFL